MTKVWPKWVAGLAMGLALGAGASAHKPKPAAMMTPGRPFGVAEGACRAGEPGPALLIDVIGLKDRHGLLRLEVYPPNDADFLGDDAGLLRAGKVFRRVEGPVPQGGAVQLCVRVPGPGAYAVVLVHDREGNHKFSWWQDGVGFPNNPRLGWSKPGVAKIRAMAGSGLTHIAIVMNYRHGLGMAPLKGGE